MMTFGRVPQAYSIVLGKQDVITDNVEIAHLLHQLPVILRVLLKRVNIRECRRSDEAISRCTEVLHRFRAARFGS